MWLVFSFASSSMYVYRFMQLLSSSQYRPTQPTLTRLKSFLATIDWDLSHRCAMLFFPHAISNNHLLAYQLVFYQEDIVYLCIPFFPYINFVNFLKCFLHNVLYTFRKHISLLIFLTSVQALWGVFGPLGAFLPP